MTTSFKQLYVWQKAYEYCLLVYKVTKKFPEFEKFGLHSQFTRAAVSIPANIAEGFGKISKADKLRFYNIAQGSLNECRCYNQLSFDLEYITNEEYEKLEYLISGTSTLLYSYCDAIIHDRSID